MKTVLMIAPYFVPRRRVGSQRPYKFAIHLRSYGYEPVILTIANTGTEMTSKEKEFLNGIKIIEIKPPFDHTANAQTNSITSEQKVKKRVANKFIEWLDKQTPMDSWIYLFMLRYLNIRNKVSEINPDLVWATGDPWSSLWLGEKLSQAFSVPFIADFRDPWTLSKMQLRERSSFSAGIDMEIEKRIVMNADKLIFTANITEENYAGFYTFEKQKTATIYNSYDSTLPGVKIEDEWGTTFDTSHLNMIFFGRFRRLSPAHSIIKAMKVLKEKNPDAAERIKIHSFGIPDEENETAIREAALDNNFVYHQPVEPEKKDIVLKHADILLLSTDAQREEIIPAKLWDYLSVHTPIFSIAPNPEVADIIMRSKAGVQVHPGEKMEIAELLETFSKEKERRSDSLFTPESDIPDRGIYEARQTTKQLASIFDELLADA